MLYGIVLIAALSNFGLLTCSAGPLKVTLGPERLVLNDGSQPYLFMSAKGTLVVQAQRPRLVSTDYPGVYGTVVSRDGGKTWQSWSPTKNQAEGPFIEGSVAQMKDGSILILEWVARGPESGGNFRGKIWRSDNEWKTITGPFEARFYLPEGKGGFDDGGNPVDGLFVHRTLMEMPNGDLVATAYGWFKEDSTPSSYMKSMNKTRAVLLRSKDHGLNWSLVSTIAVDPAVGQEGFTEPVLARLTQGKHSGRFIVLMRTGRNNPIHQTESDDEGRSWTKPRALRLLGVNPDLIEMTDGVLVCGFGGLTEWLGEGRLYLAFSFDQGITWTRITQVSMDPTSQYLTVREVKPGRLLIVYDKVPHKDSNLPQTRLYIAGRTVVARLIDVEK
jgi:BNR repeat-like domain/BNR/Asp-box repeat